MQLYALRGALLELTCPLDSMQHLEAARDRKQSKEEYLQILAELDRLGFPSHYDTIELSVLGHCSGHCLL